jgi:hypothetical protein
MCVLHHNKVYRVHNGKKNAKISAAGFAKLGNFFLLLYYFCVMDSDYLEYRKQHNLKSWTKRSFGTD